MKNYDISNEENNNPIIKHTQDKSFIAVSDFHCYRYPLEIIKQEYLKKYDVIYILGDATDRGEKLDGTGGIQLLIDIMKLTNQYPGRVIYLPGNHDEFLIGYIRSKQNMDSYYPYSYISILVSNGGLATINEIDALKENNPTTYNELISWLEKQPLQRTHKYNGTDYVLGHAIFNQKLYNINPNYALENYFCEPKNSDIRRMASQVLWFRKNKNAYNPTEMPSSDKIMIIGHTPQNKRQEQSINLIDSDENTIKVHCVDGGITHNGYMLEYDGGNEVRHTITHNVEMNSEKNPIENTPIDNQIEFNNHILSKIIKDGKIGFFELLLGSNPNELSKSECQEVIDKYIDSNIAQEEKQKRNVYIKTFLFNYILDNQIKRMQELNYPTYIAAEMIDTFLYGNNNNDYLQTEGDNGKGNYDYITSQNHTKEIVRAIGEETLIEVLHLYGCKTVKEYLEQTEKNHQNQHKR